MPITPKTGSLFHAETQWSRDELIIALDLYLANRNSLPTKDDPRVIAASELLNRLSGALGTRYESFRNANSVYMKLNNFRGLDPDYISQGKKGLSRGGKGDREAWDDFALSPADLALAAAAIRNNILSDIVPADGWEGDGIIEAPEGRLLTRIHQSRERSQKLVAERKRIALRDTGKLACEACAFDFARVYGERGKGFIEAHHLTPVHMLLPGSKTRLQDLALLCANCHRIIHASKPWLTLPELKALFA